MKVNAVKWSMLLVAVAGTLLSGCSTDQIARAVYYSFRVQNQAVDVTPPLQSRGEPMSFDRYQQERRGEPSR
jgi:uncharacterized lipoprotein YmbA